ncbi:MAG: MoaD/ThiS family protein [Acidobacteria bacterium]|nr:MoaD/ThiS family protein [Acidobacteriota bacterium]
MTKVSVLFFGATADEVGDREVDLELPENSRAEDALARIVERFPRLAAHKLLFAVNQEYASGAEIIGDGDELAVFTAVSGG